MFHAALVTQQYQSSLTVSYVYALSVWMMICIIFVFCGLIEYAIAISGWSSIGSNGSYTVNPSPNGVDTNHLNGGTDSKMLKDISHLFKNKFKPNSRNNSVDMFSRILFPSAFIITTFIYFMYYTS